MAEIRLTRRKVQALMTVFNNPLHTDMINDLEDMYAGVLNAIGSKGRLNDLFMIDVDRKFFKGLYTSFLRLAVKTDDDNSIDLGVVTGIELHGDELRIDVRDGTTSYAVILMMEEE